MRTILTTLLCALCGTISLAQQASSTDFNLDFEKELTTDKLPRPWIEWGKGYFLSVDTTEKYQGKAALRIQSPAVMDNIQFGSMANALPAIYGGKEIEVRGYLKFKDVGQGWGGLVLRIDGKAGPLQFSNMQSENLKGTRDWKQYSIKLPYSAEAEYIYIGALLVGTGTIWADNFELLIDGKPFTQAPPKKEFPAALDKEFDGGSKLGIGPGYSMTKEQAVNLAKLGRIWGFVKYHHPAAADGNYNMDYELFRVAAPYIAAKNDIERKRVLAQWLNKFGPVKELSPEAIPTDAVIKPDLAWLEKSELFAQLDSIRRARRTGEHYYIASYPNVGNPDFKNERAYNEMAYPDAGFRLLSLFRYWNMIEYFFPYKPLIREDWYAVLEEFVPKFAMAADETEYKLAALALITRVKDSHASLYGQHNALDKRFGKTMRQLNYVLLKGNRLSLTTIILS